MNEPAYLIPKGDLPRLIYAYVSINDPTTRQTILEFTEKAASVRLQLGDNEQECQISSEEEVAEALTGSASSS